MTDIGRLRPPAHQSLNLSVDLVYAALLLPRYAALPTRVGSGRRRAVPTVTLAGLTEEREALRELRSVAVRGGQASHLARIDAALRGLEIQELIGQSRALIA